MRIEVSENGIPAIENKIFDLEAKANKGLLNPDHAIKSIREIRSGLFELVGIIRKELVIVNDSTVPSGPDAA